VGCEAVRFPRGSALLPVQSRAMSLDDVADPKWRGQLRLGDRWAAWRGDVGEGALHRHFAAQAILADQPVRVSDQDGRLFEASCVLIDPLTPHRIEPGAQALFVYLEPAAHLDVFASELLKPVRTARSRVILRSPAKAFWETWLASAVRSEPKLDPRLVAVLEAVDRDLGSGPMPLRAVAARLTLSTDRFRHLFAEQMGLPYRRYLLWRRLRLAALEIMAGHDATSAAHAAGFADAAHFARTLKSTFGVTASQALLAQRKAN
jgi:AraC-like DNA-binding protein